MRSWNVLADCTLGDGFRAECPLAEDAWLHNSMAWAMNRGHHRLAWRMFAWRAPEALVLRWLDVAGPGAGKKARYVAGLHGDSVFEFDPDRAVRTQAETAMGDAVTAGLLTDEQAAEAARRIGLIDADAIELPLGGES